MRLHKYQQLVKHNSSLRRLVMLWPTLFLLGLEAVLAQNLVNRNRDGLIDTPIAGYDGLAYYSARWEPLCGTVGPLPGSLDVASTCIYAIDQFTNDTHTTLAFYDSAGVKYV